MKTSLSLAALAFAVTCPAVAMAQTNEKTPAPTPTTPVLIDAAAALAASLGVPVLESRQRPTLDHIGAYNVYGGTVCMDTLTLANAAMGTKALTTTTYEKTPGKYVMTGSFFELLEAGESLNLLDEGEAGENILDRGEAGDNVLTMVTAGHDPAELGLDKSTPLLLKGSHGGDNCTPVGILFTAPGERLAMAFFVGGKVLGVGGGEIAEIRTTPDGSGDFTLNLIVPVAMDKGIVMGLVADIPDDDFGGTADLPEDDFQLIDDAP